MKAKIKICGHCKNEKLTPERRAELRERFDEFNAKGCEEFGLRFILGGTAATAAAAACGIDASDPRIRALLMETVYRVMKNFVAPLPVAPLPEVNHAK